VQEKMDAGISVHRQVGGHSQPVGTVLFNAKFGQVVTIDRDSIITWDLATGKQLSLWHPEVLKIKGVNVGEDASRRISSACFGARMRRLIGAVDDGTVHVFNYIKQKTLKTFNTESRDEFCCCCSVVTNEGMQYSEKYVIVAGMSKRVYFFRDIETDNPEDQEVASRPACAVSIEQYGFAYSFDFVPPARLVVGTHKGLLLVFNLNNTIGIINVCNANPSFGLTHLRGGDIMRHVAQYSKTQSKLRVGLTTPTRSPAIAATMPGRPVSPIPRAESPPAHSLFHGSEAGSVGPRCNSPPGGLLQRMRMAAKHTRRISGAQAFLNFHAVTQQHTAGMVTAALFVSMTVLCTLHGNGEMCVWRVTKENAHATIALCVPVGFSPGEPATTFVYLPSKERLFVGDDRGYVSGFDLSRVMPSLQREDALKARAACRPAGRDQRESLSKETNVPASLPPIAFGERNVSITQGETEADRKADEKKATEADRRVDEKEGKKTVKARGRTLRHVSRVIRGASPRAPEKSVERPEHNNPRAVRNEHGLHLVVCFHAHPSSFVSSLATVHTDFLVSSGGDCAVKLWTADGVPVACFGRRGRWPSWLLPSSPKPSPYGGKSSPNGSPGGPKKSFLPPLAANRADPEPKVENSAEAAASPGSISPPRDVTSSPQRRAGAESRDEAESQVDEDWMNPQEPDVDTRDSISGHYFGVIFPKCVELPKPKKSPNKSPTLFADVLRKLNVATPPKRRTDSSPSLSPRVEMVDSEHPSDDMSSGSEERDNLDRMIVYSMRRTRDPDTRKMLELQRLEAKEQYQSNWGLDTTIPLALQSVRDRAKGRNPMSSQYSVLKVPDVDKQASTAPWQRTQQAGTRTWPVPIEHRARRVGPGSA